MTHIPWSLEMNFASALLLHSCLTILMKELCNFLVIVHRLGLQSKGMYGKRSVLNTVRSSAVLDAYTSVFSNDVDGELSELYFTNTGAILLCSTLAASVAMNLFLSDILLNMFVVGTFCLCFITSLLVGKSHFTLPLMALRRAGRFIWSDTPFVNFFTLIYIATVLHGNSTLRLRDYVVFRSIAVLELLFMKAKLAASSPERQEKLMKQLIESECRILPAARFEQFSISEMPMLSRNQVAAFQTYQRLSTMLFKTTIGFENGCLLGTGGPCRFRLPPTGHSIMDAASGLRICRLTGDTAILADYGNLQFQKGWWSVFLAHSHGVLLRRIGKIRVVYLVNGHSYGPSGSMVRFHSNVNLVTGVFEGWLDNFPEVPVSEASVTAVA